MDLKQSTPCCGSPTLIWNRDEARYQCPCGQFRATSTGRRIRSELGQGRNRPHTDLRTAGELERMRAAEQRKKVPEAPAGSVVAES
jgi:hypothetical protein